MMIQPIGVYDAKRKAIKRRGHEGPREANGRNRRSAANSEYLVYFIRIDGNPMLKVGRTRDMANRVRGYEHNSGSTARCHVQMIVASLADSIALENHVVAFLSARYRQHRREWFVIPDSELAAAVELLHETSPVPILRLNGAPGASGPQLTKAAEASHEARSISRQYNARRGLIR